MAAMEANPIRVTLRLLQDKYVVMGDRRPLAVGIARALVTRHPDIQAALIKGALGMHTRTTGYLKSLAVGGSRYDLDGISVGEVTEAQSMHASAQLKERFAKKAALQRAEQEAKRVQQRHEAKLQQLVARFARD